MSSEESETTVQHAEAQCADCSWAYYHHEANETVRKTGERMVEVIDRQVRSHKRTTGHEVR